MCAEVDVGVSHQYSKKCSFLEGEDGLLKRQVSIFDLRRNLLRYAVKRPESPREKATVDRHDSAVREALLEGINRGSVLRIIPDGEQHALVTDVEVGVARRNTERFTLDVFGFGWDLLGDVDRLDGDVRLGRAAAVPVHQVPRVKAV